MIQYDLERQRIQRRSQAKQQTIANTAAIVENGAKLVDTIGNVFGENQAKDFNKKFWKDFQAAKESGRFDYRTVTNKDGTKSEEILSFDDIRTEYDKFVEEEMASAPDNPWARSLITKSLDGQYERNMSTAMQSNLEYFNKRKTKDMNEVAETAKNQQIDNPAAYNQSLLDIFSITYGDLNDYEKNLFDAFNPVSSNLLYIDLNAKRWKETDETSRLYAESYRTEIAENQYIDDMAILFSRYVLNGDGSFTPEMFYEKLDEDIATLGVDGKGSFLYKLNDNARKNLTDRVKARLKTDYETEQENVMNELASEYWPQLVALREQNQLITTEKALEIAGPGFRWWLLDDETKAPLMDWLRENDYIDKAWKFTEGLNSIFDREDLSERQKADMVRSELGNLSIVPIRNYVNAFADSTPYIDYYSSLSKEEIVDMFSGTIEGVAGHFGRTSEGTKASLESIKDPSNDPFIQSVMNDPDQVNTIALLAVAAEGGTIGIATAELQSDIYDAWLNTMTEEEYNNLSDEEKNEAYDKWLDDWMSISMYFADNLADYKLADGTTFKNVLDNVRTEITDLNKTEISEFATDEQINPVKHPAFALINKNTFNDLITKALFVDETQRDKFHTDLQSVKGTLTEDQYNEIQNVLNMDGNAKDIMGQYGVNLESVDAAIDRYSGAASFSESEKNQIYATVGMQILPDLVKGDISAAQAQQKVDSLVQESLKSIRSMELQSLITELDSMDEDKFNFNTFKDLSVDTVSMLTEYQNSPPSKFIANDMAEFVNGFYSGSISSAYSGLSQLKTGDYRKGAKKSDADMDRVILGVFAEALNISGYDPNSKYTNDELDSFSASIMTELNGLDPLYKAIVMNDVQAYLYNFNSADVLNGEYGLAITGVNEEDPRWCIATLHDGSQAEIRVKFDDKMRVVDIYERPLGSNDVNGTSWNMEGYFGGGRERFVSDLTQNINIARPYTQESKDYINEQYKAGKMAASNMFTASATVGPNSNEMFDIEGNIMFAPVFYLDYDNKLATYDGVEINDYIKSVSSDWKEYAIGYEQRTGYRPEIYVKKAKANGEVVLDIRDIPIESR